MSRTVRRALTGVAAGAALVVGVASAPSMAAPTQAVTAKPSTSSAQQHAAKKGNASGALTQQLSGTWTDKKGRTGAVSGTLTPTKFMPSKDGKALMVQADMVVKTTSNKAKVVKRTMTFPVKSITSEAASTERTGFTNAALPAQPAPVPAGCDILNLDLGPLNLNLLGLVVVLQPVVLDIVAVPGPGNLLGNLLCAVAGLLDGNGGVLGGLLGQLGIVLNSILQILNLTGGGAAAAPAVLRT